MTHDTLGQIREHLEAISGHPWSDEAGAEVMRKHAGSALAKFDALLAEGRIHAPDENSVTQWQPFLAIPLLVGVGCGNTTNEKDKP